MNRSHKRWLLTAATVVAIPACGSDAVEPGPPIALGSIALSPDGGDSGRGEPTPGLVSLPPDGGAPGVIALPPDGGTADARAGVIALPPDGGDGG
jgi:hypothetical protein